jgi:DUF4097 and DUF4098 domain-containing protein YvlB
MTPNSLKCAVLCACFASMAAPAPGHEPTPPLTEAALRAPDRERDGQARREAGPNERFSRTFRTGRAGILDVSNISGDITVTGGSGEDIVIEAVKSARGRDVTTAESELAGVSIEATERAGRVEVRTVYTTAHARVSVDYTITCPVGTAVYLRSVSGSIRATEIRGELTAETVSGDVRVERAGQVSHLGSVSGDVEIASGTAPQELSVSNVSGNVVGRGIQARSLDLSTVSGDLRLTDVACERANIRTVSGTVDYRGNLAKNGRYELKTHSGNVRLDVGGGAGFELNANTFSGEVRTDLPLTLRTAGEGGSESRSRLRNRSLRGTFGDASAVVVVTTFSGDVTIVKR